MIRPISIFLLIILFVQGRSTVLATNSEGFWLVLLLCIIPFALIISAKYSNTTKINSLIATVLILFSWAVTILLFSWDDSVRKGVGYTVVLGDVIVLLPAVFWLFVLWFVTSPIPNRRSFALYRFRLDILLLFVPVFVFFGVCELSSELGATEGVLDVVLLMTFLVVLLLSPFFISTILSTKQMENLELRSSIIDAGLRAGIQYNRILVWNTHNRIINAMAIGLFFQSRSIVFTDKLISKLTQSELLAIAAHEIAHHKYWHIPFLVITLLCSMVWSTKLFELFDLELSEAYMYAMNIAIMLLTLILVSRRFESQADSYAVVNLSTAQGSDVVTEDSVKVMTNALEIACNNQKKNSNSHDPLHGSIKSRQLTLQKLVGRRISDISINKQVKWFKVTIVIALIAGIVV